MKKNEKMDVMRYEEGDDDMMMIKNIHQQNNMKHNGVRSSYQSPFVLTIYEKRKKDCRTTETTRSPKKLEAK